MQKSKQDYKNIRGESGLLLVEILVTIAIIAMTTIMVYKVLTHSFDINERLSKDHTIYLSLSIATDAIHKDIAQIFSPNIKLSRINRSNTPELFWGPLQREDGLRRTRFTGEKEKLYFITASKRRIYKNVAEFELQKVIWEIKEQKDGTYTLFRTTSKNIFDYDEEDKIEKQLGVAILEDIRTANFSFYNNENAGWDENWDSEANYAQGTSRFPTIVRLKLEMLYSENMEDTVPWESTFKPIMALNESNNAANK